MGVLALKELTLSHFRSHLGARLRLSGGPVAIYGPNGAGKTNILEAISLLSPGRGLRRAAPDEIARRPQALGWKVSALLQSLHQMHEVETWAEPGASRSVTIDGKPAPQVALGRIARILWLVPSMDRLWIEAAEGRRRFLDRMVLSFEPGHAEAVRVTYDPSVVRYDQLLQILFSVGADPTLHNRQGPDRGPQYRAAIVPVTPEQRAVAEAYVEQMDNSGVWDRPMAVAIERYREFYEAEDYHQDFMLKNPDSGYIVRWDAPKVEALRENFPDLYRSRFRTG